MDDKELEQILDETDFSWIKTKRFEEPTVLAYERNYKILYEHYQKETEFLIKRCRELATAAKFGNYMLNMIQAFGDSFVEVEDKTQAMSADAYIKVWEKQQNRIKELEDKLATIRRGY